LASLLNSFRSNRDWEYEISSIIKANDEFSSMLMVQGDFLMRFIYDKSYWFGAGYRTTNDFIALTGFKYDRLYVTYSFDYGTNGISQNSYGSHEISLSLKYGESVRRFNWLDRY